MPCVCGHAPEDHRDETRECQVEGCRCVMYEEAEEDGNESDHS